MQDALLDFQENSGARKHIQECSIDFRRRQVAGTRVGNQAWHVLEFEYASLFIQLQSKV